MPEIPEKMTIRMRMTATAVMTIRTAATAVTTAMTVTAVITIIINVQKRNLRSGDARWCISFYFIGNSSGIYL